MCLSLWRSLGPAMTLFRQASAVHPPAWPPAKPSPPTLQCRALHRGKNPSSINLSDAVQRTRTPRLRARARASDQDQERPRPRPRPGPPAPRRPALARRDQSTSLQVPQCVRCVSDPSKCLIRSDQIFLSVFLPSFPPSTIVVPNIGHLFA